MVFKNTQRSVLDRGEERVPPSGNKNSLALAEGAGTTAPASLSWF